MSTVELGKVVDIVQEKTLTDTDSDAFDNFLDEHLPRVEAPVDEKVLHRSEYPSTLESSNLVTVLKMASPNGPSTTYATRCTVDDPTVTPGISVVFCEEEAHSGNQSISGRNVFINF
jgi:hypothetical protein